MGAGAALVGAGTGLQALSSLQAGEQEEKISKYNAAVMESEAVAVEKKTEFDEALHRERVRKAMSTQRARLGKAGIEVSGSAQRALEESAIAGELDALAIRHGGEVEAARARSGAKLERARGKSAKRAGRLRAGTSLLTGGFKAFGGAS